VKGRLAAYRIIVVAYLEEKLAIGRIIRARIRREIAVARLRRGRRARARRRSR
jgi:hypothetical protein